MLSEKEIRDKLYDQPAMFRHHMSRKNYLNAALCADWAQMTAHFIGLDEKSRTELFGDRQPDEPIEGLLKEDEHIKASWWCVLHGYEKSIHTYQEIQRML